MSTQTSTTMTRWKLTLTTLEETGRYLSRMCADGWRPVRVAMGGLRFVFVPTEPGEFVCATAATVKTSGSSAGSLDRRKYAELARWVEAQGGTIVPQTGTAGTQEGIIAVRRADRGPWEICQGTGATIDDLKARLAYHRLWALYFMTFGLVYLGMSVVLPFLIVGVAFSGFAVPYVRAWHRYAKAVRRLEPDQAVLE